MSMREKPLLEDIADYRAIRVERGAGTMNRGRPFGIPAMPLVAHTWTRAGRVAEVDLGQQPTKLRPVSLGFARSQNINMLSLFSHFGRDVVRRGGGLDWGIQW